MSFRGISLNWVYDCKVYHPSLTRRQDSEKTITHTEQLLQKRDEIRPFVHALERGESLLHLLRVFLIFRVGLYGKVQSNCARIILDELFVRSSSTRGYYWANSPCSRSFAATDRGLLPNPCEPDAMASYRRRYDTDVLSNAGLS